MSIAKERRRRQGKGLYLSWMYILRLPSRNGEEVVTMIGEEYPPFSMNSDIMKIRPSGAGARERPRYKTTFGCLASLSHPLATGQIIVRLTLTSSAAIPARNILPHRSHSKARPP